MSRCVGWEPTPAQWQRLVNAAGARRPADPAYSPEDVAQEAYLRLARWVERGHEVVGGEEGHMRFMFTVIRHCLTDIARRRGRLVEQEDTGRSVEDRHSAGAANQDRRLTARLELAELRALDPVALDTMVAYVQHAPERPSIKQAYRARLRLRATLSPDDPRRARLR